MLESSLIYTLMRSFPESILVLISFIILLDIKMAKSDIIKTGLLLGIIISAIRVLPISFGVHTILSMCTYVIVIMKLANIKLINSVITSCEVFIALAISEGIYFALATSVLNISENILLNNASFKSAIVTLPSLIIFIIIIIMLRKIIYFLKKG